jgi:hypothetical protein
MQKIESIPPSGGNIEPGLFFRPYFPGLFVRRKGKYIFDLNRRDFDQTLSSS